MTKWLWACCCLALAVMGCARRHTGRVLPPDSDRSLPTGDPTQTVTELEAALFQPGGPGGNPPLLAPEKICHGKSFQTFVAVKVNVHKVFERGDALYYTHWPVAELLKLEEKHRANARGEIRDSDFEWEASGGAFLERGALGQGPKVIFDAHRAAAEGPFKLKVTFKPDPRISRELTFLPDISCAEPLVELRGFAGRRESPDGGRGRDVKAVVTRASTAMLGPVTLVWGVVDGKYQHWVFDPKAKIRIVSRGGEGYPGDSARLGGNGGDGGNVHVTVDEGFPELSQQVDAQSFPGYGGGGKKPGRDGAAGAAEVVVGPVQEYLSGFPMPRGLTLTRSERAPAAKPAPVKARPKTRR